MNIAIFVSGSGTNCEALIKHFQQLEINGVHPVNTAVVVSNRKDAYALERAKRLNVSTEIITNQQLQEGEYMGALLIRYEIDFIILAGFLAMIPDYIIEAFPRQIINLHPALLPKFGGKGMYGHHVHEAVMAAGEKETGMTVHYVSEVCDGGEIIAQYSTPLTPEDTPETIAAKEHELEMRYFPQVVERVLLKCY